MRPSIKASMFRTSMIPLAISLLFASHAYAGQSDAQRIAELEKKLEKSLIQIEQLANRLNLLEGGTAGSPPNAVTGQIATQEDRIERLEKNLVQVSENAASRNDLGVPLRGFADVGYASKAADGRKGGFTLGTLDIYLTPQFGDRVKSIIELAFEFGTDGALATDLERMQIGYTFSDAATLWAGRFHTPYGYWNTAFHHGLQIQTSTARPRFIGFEDQGGMLPTHAVGLLANGGMRVGPGKVQYDAYVANGNNITNGELDFNSFKDDNTNKMVGGNLRYAFGDALSGLTLGLHGLSQQVDVYASDTAGNLEKANSTKLNVFGGFAVYDNANWELVGEYYRFRNKDLSGATGTHSSWAGFAQAGYTFANKWTPYLRFEKAAVDQTDSYFAGQISGRPYQRHVMGLRYDVNQFSAIKLELNQTKEEQAVEPELKTNEARVQFAVRF